MMMYVIMGMLVKGYTPEQVVASVISNPVFANVPAAEVVARVNDVIQGLHLTAEAFILTGLFSS